MEDTQWYLITVIVSLSLKHHLVYPGSLMVQGVLGLYPPALGGWVPKESIYYFLLVPSPEASSFCPLRLQAPPPNTQHSSSSSAELKAVSP